MLTYLLGDVLRIYSGDFQAGKLRGVQITGNQWLGVAALMVTPVVMAFLSLALNYPVNRWANIIVAIIFFGFNLIGLPNYPSAYDKFLITVGLGFNINAPLVNQRLAKNSDGGKDKELQREAKNGNLILRAARET